MKKKSFVKNNKLYLGGKKQKGGFIGVLGLGLAIPRLTKLLTRKGRKKKEVEKGKEDGKKKKQYCFS